MTRLGSAPLERSRPQRNETNIGCRAEGTRYQQRAGVGGGRAFFCATATSDPRSGAQEPRGPQGRRALENWDFFQVYKSW